MKRTSNKGGEKIQKKTIDYQKLSVSIKNMNAMIEILNNSEENIPQSKLRELKAAISGAFEDFKDKKQIYFNQIQILNNFLKTIYDQKSNEDETHNNISSINNHPPSESYFKDEFEIKEKPKPNHKGVNKSEKTNALSLQNRMYKASLNIWTLSENFFSPLPSNNEIKRLFENKMPPIDHTSFNSKYHWTQKFAELAKNSNKNALLPCTPTNNEINSQYWKNNKPTFPIENSEYKKYSVLHTLLNAMVVATPIHKTEVNQENCDDILNQHPILPKIEVNTYLCHDFETRLQLELQSIGLSYLEDDSDTRPFQNEINEISQEIEEKYQPELDKYYNMLLKKLPEMRKKEESRINNQTIYDVYRTEKTGVRHRQK